MLAFTAFHPAESHSSGLRVPAISHEGRELCAGDEAAGELERLKPHAMTLELVVKTEPLPDGQLPLGRPENWRNARGEPPKPQLPRPAMRL